METQFNLLSHTQKSIWIKQNLYPDSSLFNIGGYTELSGSDLNVDLVLKSYQLLLENTDIVRFAAKHFADDIPASRLFICEFIDFTEHTAPAQACISWMQADIKNKIGFPGTCLKVILLKASSTSYFLYTIAHHLLLDGYSFKLLNSKASAIYTSLREGAVPDIQEDKLLFSDFIREESVLKDRSDYPALKAFWKNRLQDVSPDKGFESLVEASQQDALDSERKYYTIDRNLFNQIQAFCSENQCTPFHYFITAILLLNKIYQNEPFSLGLPIFNRNNKKYKNTTGIFISILPFYIKLSDEITFVEALTRVKDELKSCYRNQRFPIIDLHNELNLGQNYFNVMFSYQKVEHARQLFGVESPDNAHLHSGQQEEDINFHLIEYPEPSDIKLAVDFKTNLFREEKINELVKNLNFLLHDLHANPNRILGNTSFLEQADKDLLLGKFNDTSRALPEGKMFLDLFREKVLLHPDSTAVIYKERKLSYASLNSLSNQLAHYLIKNYGIVRDGLVALELNRSEWGQIAILAIFKAGGAYLPIDPSHPRERIDGLIKTAKCQALINEEELQKFRKEMKEYSEADLPIVNKPSDLAYVIFTSGSTGQPKGSMIEHAGMLNHLLAMADQMHLSASSKIVQNAEYTFDVSVWQLLNPLMAGGISYIYDNEIILDPSAFTAQLEEDGITILQVVPSYLKALLESLGSGNHHGFGTMNYLLVTGEAVAAPLLRCWFKLYPNIKVVNAYGPAEASDDVTLHILTQSPEGTNVPVGKPIQNIKIYIVDKSNRLCPIGAEGEICVSGIGVGRGYLNDPERTKQSFVSDPFQPAGTTVRMYRTGDIGRWTSGGLIEFTGRRDDQVKIRGYRIELGEIENALLKNESIAEVVLMAREGPNLEKILVAFLVGKKKLHIDSIRTALSSILPAYMVPAYFIELEKMPLNANGKVNKKALLHIPWTEKTAVYISPESEVEKKLAEIWSEVLGVERIGLSDNFFELGGHSLKLIRVFSKIHEAFNVKIPMNLFFQDPFIPFLAQYIGAASFAPVSSNHAEEKELIF
jgi:amino acid adenylation domain-containing protein